MDRLIIASAQLNPCVGDIAGNIALARAARAQATSAGADLLVLSELFVIGYPPEDLVLKPSAVQDCRDALEAFARETEDGGPAVLIGLPWQSDDGLHNAIALVDGGAIQAVRFKRELPNYAVFDEKRVFVPGKDVEPVMVRGVPIGVPICEDIWFPETCNALKRRGAQLLIVPNGSPYRRHVPEQRLEVARARAAETGLPLIYVNQLGGQDELAFDGGSFSITATGDLVQTLPRFSTALSVATWRRIGSTRWTCEEAELLPQLEGEEADYAAMVLALRDYIEKNRFPGVVLGLSGGIDSAITAAVAVDALGSDRVHCVMMPSRYTSQESLDDALGVATFLGVRLTTIDIEPAVTAYSTMLAPLFADSKADITEENIQSRARAVTLMALSNKFGAMVLTTGNKSEMAVGYATLYGDMCGGYNVLKDLYKTEVFDLSRWRNAHRPPGALGPEGPVMPVRVIDKPPTAELRANQTDQDSLPPYEALDDMLRGLVDREEDLDALVARGHAPDVIKRVQSLLYTAEYKRRQAPPGVKIGGRNFGRDRRYPITNRYRDVV